MTNDANDNRPQPVSGRSEGANRPGGAAADGGEASPSHRRLSNRSAKGDSTSAGPTAPGTPKGAPTPGRQTPPAAGPVRPRQHAGGRREEPPHTVAHPLTGTAPKAVNEPPSAPAGSGSAPTTPRPVEQGHRAGATVPADDLAGRTAPAGRSETAPPASTGASAQRGAGERPDNPFAPRSEEPRAPLFSRGRTVSAKTEPDGRRAATSTGILKRREPAESHERAPLGRGNVVALAVAGVSVVAVIALIATSALWWFDRDNEVAGATRADLSATPGPVLGSGQMMSETMARSIDPTRTWSQTLDQAGINDASPNIACVGPLTPDQPMPQITQLRGLSASGDDRTAALHRADAYATAEEAQRVFESRSAELGSCTDTPLYVENGLDVTGIGDESLGVRLALQDETPEYHSVMLVRTGRIVNLLDVARLGEAADMTALLEGLSPSINRQCGPAVGLCTAPTTSVSVGIPPAGGEQPGLLTSGDIPRVTPGSGTWRGSPPITQVDVQDGSSCEAVDFASVGGTGATRQQRTYLLRNDAGAPAQFGVDQVVLDMGSAEEAAQLVGQVSGNIASCGTRTLTSEMEREAPLLTPGQDGVEVRGNWFIVNSQIDQGQAQRYRIGIVSAGDKVVYLRSNPSQTFDFTDDAWIAVNLRAGERVTQTD